MNGINAQAVVTGHGRYSGMSREDLVEILIRAGGDRTQVQDPEAFTAAWRTCGRQGQT